MDYIINEITDVGQRTEVDSLIQNGKLYVKEFDENEFRDIIDL